MRIAIAGIQYRMNTRHRWDTTSRDTQLAALESTLPFPVTAILSEAQFRIRRSCVRDGTDGRRMMATARTSGDGNHPHMGRATKTTEDTVGPTG